MAINRDYDRNIDKCVNIIILSIELYDDVCAHEFFVVKKRCVETLSFFFSLRPLKTKKQKIKMPPNV